MDELVEQGGETLVARVLEVDGVVEFGDGGYGAVVGVEDDDFD
jgi:hypothetical protein